MQDLVVDLHAIGQPRLANAESLPPHWLFQSFSGHSCSYWGWRASKPLTGPRGGKIKKISPTTGKPIYYKPWSTGQGYNTPPVASEDKGGYEVYKKGSVIGKTRTGTAHPFRC